MTPKEKAEELYYKFDHNSFLFPKEAIAHSIICVDEIIDAIDKSLINSDIEFFKQVKQEIEKL